MNWKVDTIANSDNAKGKPESGLPIRIAPRAALSGVPIPKSAERTGALTLVDMTQFEDAPECRKSETDQVYIGRVQGESASSFLVAIQIVQNTDRLQGDSPEAVNNHCSVNQLPLNELFARVCAALKRNQASDEQRVLFRIGELHLDASRHLVQKSGRPLHLTPKEFALLHNLMMNAGRPVPHTKLLRSVWGSQYGCEREYLRIYVRQLRLKIEDDPANPKYLLTEPNIGYRFAESLEEDSVIPSSGPIFAEA